MLLLLDFGERERERESGCEGISFSIGGRERYSGVRNMVGLLFFFLGESEPFVLFQESKKVESFF